MSRVKIELTSENDLFFNYICQIDDETFRQMQVNQKLMIEFLEYTKVLINMASQCIKEPNTYLACFIMTPAGSAKLDFVQNVQYKFIELLSVDFVAAEEEMVRSSITFRYNSLKSKIALMEARLKDVNNLVKLKNPSLLL